MAEFGGQRSGNDQFAYYLCNLAVDLEEAMFIFDKGNRRVVKWKRNAQSGRSVVSSINCFGVTWDRKELLYVSDLDNDVVLKFNVDLLKDEVVVGGNGNCEALSQLN